MVLMFNYIYLYANSVFYWILFIQVIIDYFCTNKKYIFVSQILVSRQVPEFCANVYIKKKNFFF